MRKFLIRIFTFAVVAAGIAAEPAPASEKSSPQTIQEAEAALAAGGASPQLYYHLAVAEEDAGNIVDAALNYQRALMLDPGLRVAQNKFSAFAAKNNIGMRPRSWQDDVVSFIHPETLLIIGMSVGWIGAIWLGWMIFAGFRSRWHIALAVFVLLLGSALFSMGYVSDPRVADANLSLISAGAAVKVLSGPTTNSDVIVELNPGSAVGVISPRGSWTFIMTPGGAKGWVASDRLVSVIPSEASTSSSE